MFKFKAHHQNLSDYLMTFLIILIPLICSTVFRDYYVVTKWAFFTSSISLLSIFLGLKIFKEKSLSLPLLSKKEFSLIGLWFFFLLFQAKHISNPSFLDLLLHILLPLILFLFFSLRKKDFTQFFFQKFIFLNFISSMMLVLSYYVQLITGYKSVMIRTDFSLFFGNVNLAAQYVGLSLLLSFHLIHSIKNKTRKWFFYFFLFLQCLYLCELECRSILLGLFVTLVILSIWTKKIRTLLTIFILSITFHGAYDYIKKQSSSSLLSGDSHYVLDGLSSGKSIKKGSTYIRMKLWSAALKLIQQKPISGHGVDSFSFQSTPYLKGQKVISEGLFFNNPHNEYLRVAQEYGLPYFITSLLILLGLVLKLYKNKTINSARKYCLLSICLLTAFESFFQFPLFNAPVFFVLNLVFLSCLNESFKFQTKEIKITTKIFISFFLCLFITLSSLKTLSWYLNVNSKKYEHIKLACRLWPNYWHSCLRLTRANSKNGRFTEALADLNKILKFHPYHYTALHMKALVYGKTKKLEQACKYAKKYDDIFSNRSKLSPFISKYCLK